ncbi:MAG: hypothetical protein RLZZ68_1813 [Bacteroidota bacterium]|jgi:hypothetical protein|nr:hypothetical protein [Flavobacteriia bacterium]NBP28309.1 hypothetical protein [Flavobacteriia bacterium]
MQRSLFLVVVAVFVLTSCKSKVCECADAHLKAVKEINKTNDPIKKIKILGKEEYQGIFEECNQLTRKMSPEELKAFESEYEQCPSVREYNRRNPK